MIFALIISYKTVQCSLRVTLGKWCWAETIALLISTKNLPVYTTVNRLFTNPHIFKMENREKFFICWSIPLEYIENTQYSLLLHHTFFPQLSQEIFLLETLTEFYFSEAIICEQ